MRIIRINCRQSIERIKGSDDERGMVRFRRQTHQLVMRADFPTDIDGEPWAMDGRGPAGRHGPVPLRTWQRPWPGAAPRASR